MSHQLCEERKRLQSEFYETVVSLKTRLNRQMYAVAGRPVDVVLECRIADAQVEHETARAALLRHIREHGC
jgi:hypothetical protein